MKADEREQIITSKLRRSYLDSHSDVFLMFTLLNILVWFLFQKDEPMSIYVHISLNETVPLQNSVSQECFCASATCVSWSTPHDTYDRCMVDK